MLTVLGNVLYDQGDFAEAKQAYLKALSTEREVGNQRGVASLMNNLGNVLDMEGDISGSWRMKTESLKIRREIGDRPSVAASLNNVGNLLWKRAISVARGFFIGRFELFRTPCLHRSDRIGP